MVPCRVKVSQSERTLSDIVALAAGLSPRWDLLPALGQQVLVHPCSWEPIQAAGLTEVTTPSLEIHLANVQSVTITSPWVISLSPIL